MFPGFPRNTQENSRYWRCSAHEAGRLVIRTRRVAVSSTGWLPSRIASMISGARKARGISRLTSAAFFEVGRGMFVLRVARLSCEWYHGGNLGDVIGQCLNVQAIEVHRDIGFQRQFGPPRRLVSLPLLVLRTFRGSPTIIPRDLSLLAFRPTTLAPRPSRPPPRQRKRGNAHCI